MKSHLIIKLFILFRTQLFSVSIWSLTLHTDLHDAASLLSRQVSKLAFLPLSHTSALDIYVSTLQPSSSSPSQALHATLLSLQSTIQAILTALSRPPQLAAQIAAARRAAERAYRSLMSSSSASAVAAGGQGSSPSSSSGGSRWPLAGLGLGLGLLDDTRQRITEERVERARRTAADADALARELRYTQQTVAGELAGWQDLHGRLARRALREYARAMLVQERERLVGLRRAARRFGALDLGGGGGGGQRLDSGDVGTSGSGSTANGKGVVAVADSRKAPPAAPVTTTATAVATDGDGGTQAASGSGNGNGNGNYGKLPGLS